MDSAPPDNVVGSWVLEQFHVRRVLAEGGMGKLYLAEQPLMERQAVIKTILARGEDEAQSNIRERFQVEARAISRLAHPNIVTVYNFGTLPDGAHFLAMEYVDGVGLDQIRIPEGLSPIRVVNLIHQCASGLEYAHQLSIIHRDLKPQNIMVQQLLARDHVKILDFGLAQIQGEAANESLDSVGTPQYLSPEASKGEKTTAASDQYQLGLMMYELLAGSPVFVADSVLGYMNYHKFTTPPPPSQKAKDPSVSLLDPIVMRMLEKDPQQRFPSMAMLQQALQSVGEKLVKRAKLHEALRWAASDRFPAMQEPPPTPPPFAQPSFGDLQSQPSIAPLPYPANEPKKKAPLQLRVRLVDSTMQANARAMARRLAASGIELETRRSFHSESESDIPTYWILIATASETPSLFERAQAAGIRDRRLLACVLADGKLPPTGRLPSNVLLSESIPDCEQLRIALRGMRGAMPHPLDELCISQRCEEIYALSVDSHWMDNLEASLRENGVMSTHRQYVREIADELILNVFAHNRSKRGESADYRLDRPARLTWSVTDERVLISVKDFYGSLKADEVRKSSRYHPPHEAAVALSGLRLVLQTAGQVWCFLNPGTSTEIVASIPRTSGTSEASLAPLTILTIPDLGKTTPRKSRNLERQIGNRLWLRTETEDSATVSILRGDVDQSSDLQAVFNGNHSLDLDLSAVDAVSMAGVRAWIAVRPSVSGIRAFGCPSVVIRKALQIPEFIAREEIKSILACFRCPQCSQEKEFEVKVDRNAAPSLHCEGCQTRMAMDEISKQFLERSSEMTS